MEGVDQFLVWNGARKQAARHDEPGACARRVRFRYRIGAVKTIPADLFVVADILEFRVDDVFLRSFARAGVRGVSLLRLVHRLAQLH